MICRIVSGVVPAKLVHEDDLAIAFQEIAPQAPVHLLVVPRVHVATLADLADQRLAGHLLKIVRKVAAEAGVGENFRLVVNNGGTAGQSVWHLHLHVLGGREFTWPPG